MDNTASVDITSDAIRSLHALREKALLKPVDVDMVTRLVYLSAVTDRHRQQMIDQTVELPGSAKLSVTFSLEVGRPGGMHRHMRLCVSHKGCELSQNVLWKIASELGFTGSLQDCNVQWEKVNGRLEALQVDQRINTSSVAEATA